MEFDQEEEDRPLKKTSTRQKKSTTFVDFSSDEENEEDEMPTPGQRKRVRSPDSLKVERQRGSEPLKKPKLLTKADQIPSKLMEVIDLTKEYVRSL